MKKTLILCGIAALALSCSSDDDNNNKVESAFEKANPNVVTKFIKTISVTTAYDGNVETSSTTLNYNESTGQLLNAVSTTSDAGNNTSSISYDSNGNPKTASNGTESFNVSDLYKKPYDAYKEGNVLEYDNNGNPTKIEQYDEIWDYINGEDVYSVDTIINTFTYDTSKPNPFFYTLRAGGAIYAMENTQLAFGETGEKLEKARKLLFNNLPTEMVRKKGGDVIMHITTNYLFDSDKYPTSAVVTIIDPDDPTDTQTQTYHFTYK